MDNNQEPMPTAEPTESVNTQVDTQVDTQVSENSPKKELKYTDEDVNRIIDEKFKKWSSKQAKKEQEAQRLAGLSEAEKAKELQKQADERAAELQAQLDRMMMKQTANKLLSEASMPVSDTIVDLITTNEAETTKKNVDALVAYGKKIADAVRAEYLRGTPQKVSGHPLDQSVGSLGKRLAEERNKKAQRKNPYFK